MDTYREHREQFEEDMAPLRDAVKTARELGAAYAQIGVRMLFLLNGGALIAFPAFKEILGDTTGIDPTLFISSFVCFVVGLVSIAATTLTAYLSLEFDAGYNFKRMELAAIDFGTRYYAALRANARLKIEETGDPDGRYERYLEGLDDTKYSESERDKVDRRESAFRKVAVGLSLVSVLLAIGSMVAFVLGARDGVNALSAALGT